MNGRNIKNKNGIILARYLCSDDWAQGLCFFSNEGEAIQVGTWSYESGKTLQRHIHNEVPRKVLRTQEVIFIKQGRVMADIYDLDETLVEKVELREGDALILLDCGHGYTILDDKTKVLEIKNGPYSGADIDRRRF